MVLSWAKASILLFTRIWVGKTTQPDQISSNSEIKGIGMKGIWVRSVLLALLLVGTLLGVAQAQGSTSRDRSVPLALGKLKVAEFENYVEKTRKTWQVPGVAVAIVEKDKLVYAKGFGVKQVGTTDPIDAHSIFQVGSTSKAFTTALLAQVVDQQKVAWTDPVIQHLPDFQMADPWVTKEFQVRDLTAQHSGLPSYAGDMQSFIGFDRNHIIHSLRYQQPVTSFRTTFAYVNNLFLVAAQLVEKYTGMSWEATLQRNIFDPLGMTESSAGLKAFQAATNLAIPHAKVKDKIVPLGKDWPFQDWVYTYGPAGGINSNVLDMAQWLRFQLRQGRFAGKPLITAKNLTFTHTPQTILAAGENAKGLAAISPLFGRGNYYAQGWLYIERSPYPIVWHNGGTSGCATVVAFIPDADIGIVVLSNLSGTKTPEILAQWFFDHYLGTANQDWNQIVFEHSQQSPAPSSKPPSTDATTDLPDPANPPAKPLPPLPLTAYAGTYRSPIYGDITIISDKERLTLTIGPKQVKRPLTHYDRNRFIWSLQEVLDFDEIVQFDVVGSQAVKLTMLELEAHSRDGIFERVGSE